MHLGEDAVVLGQYGRQVIQGREAGAVVLVLYGLTRRAVSEISTGDWAAAAAGEPKRWALPGPPARPPSLGCRWRGSRFSQPSAATKRNTPRVSPSSKIPAARGTRASPASYGAT